MSHRVRAWLPWMLLGLSSGLTLLSLALLAVNRSQPHVHIFDFWIEVTVIAAVCPITGSVIASQRPENRIGWIFCAIGVLVAVDHLSAEYAIYALLASDPALPGGEAVAWIRAWIWVVYHALFVFLGLLFPTGRLPSHRWRPFAWLTVSVIVLGATSLALTPGSVDGLGPIQNPLGIEQLRFVGAPTMVSLVETVLSVLALGGAASLALRVRHAQGEERLQLKWFAYAAMIAAAGGAITYVFADAITPDWARWAGWILLEIGMLGLPIAVGIAVLRYRLYHIDAIINRTLVYGLLTTLLAMIYFGSVVVLQRLLETLTGGGSDLAVVGSTLGIAALFQPLRRGLQSTIDRRFYRRKYDAARTLQSFSATSRDEVDLETLRQRLLAMVDETMQPEHLSIWLRDMPTSSQPDS